MAEIRRENQLRLVVYLIIYRVSYIPGGVGFQPSTVSQGFMVLVYLPTLHLFVAGAVFSGFIEIPSYMTDPWDVGISYPYRDPGSPKLRMVMTCNPFILLMEGIRRSPIVFLRRSHSSYGHFFTSQVVHSQEFFHQLVACTNGPDGSLWDQCS